MRLDKGQDSPLVLTIFFSQKLRIRQGLEQILHNFWYCYSPILAYLVAWEWQPFIHPGLTEITIHRIALNKNINIIKVVTRLMQNITKSCCSFNNFLFKRKYITNVDMCFLCSEAPLSLSISVCLSSSYIFLFWVFNVWKYILRKISNSFATIWRYRTRFFYAWMLFCFSFHCVTIGCNSPLTR